jgi:pimeloyl-ACP methyl ester carboxylesterase
MHGPLLALLLLFIAVGVIVCAAMAALAAWALLHPPRMTDGKALWVLKRLAPSDLGLEFAEIPFVVRDRSGERLKIASWWIPNKNSVGRCAVLIHGYADAKVGVIAWAPIWHALGFNVLVPDLRAHGESEGSVCTGGYLEREDLRQVLDELLARKPQETRQLVLFGVSLGAAVAVALAAERDDIAAVILDSPYSDFRSAAIEHMYRLGLPFRWLAAVAADLAQWFTGAAFDEVAPTQSIPKLHCPLLLVESDAHWVIKQRYWIQLKDALKNIQKKCVIYKIRI